MSRFYDKDVERARELSQLWDDNEKTMGEWAAFNVACEQMGIEEEEGWELLSLLPDDEGDDQEY